MYQQNIHYKISLQYACVFDFEKKILVTWDTVITYTRLQSKCNNKRYVFYKVKTQYNTNEMVTIIINN